MNEQQELDEKINNLEAELSTEKKATNNAEKWIAVLKQYSNPTKLTAELLNTLVEKILIHETEKTASEKPNSSSISSTASSVKSIKPKYP